jgi:hypothetical protein
VIDKRIVCVAFAPITYSRLDTKPTRDQVTEYNATHNAICPPSAPVAK